MKTKCTCDCHTPGNMIMHMQACCNNGWIETPDLDTKQYLKDGDWFRYYYEDIGTITEQHSELFHGKQEINPEWKVITEEIGTVYIIKPKKEDGN